MTPDDLFATVFLSATGGVGILAALIWRHASAQQALYRDALAWSAAQRAQQAEDGATPPDGREPAPEQAPAPVAHLATVIDLNTRRAA